MASPEPDKDIRTANIVRGIGFLSIQGVITALLGFVLLAALLRFLPSLDYSAYAAVQVTVGLAAVVSNFGFGSAAVRFLAPEAMKEGSAGWGTAKASLALTTLFAGASCLVLALAAPYLSDYFLKGPSYAWVFYLGALWLFSSSMSSLLMAVLQGMRRYRLLAGVVVGSRVVAVAVAAVALVLYQSLQIALLSWALYGALVSLAVIFVIRGPLIGAKSRPYFRTVWKYAAPLGVAGVVTAVAGNADIVVVGGYLNPGALGIYNATVVISGVVSFLLVGPLTTALFAETSFSSGKEDEVRQGTSLALRFAVIAVLPTALFAAAMAPQLIGLFSGGGTYSQGVPYLQLITLFYVFTAVQAIASSIMQGVGNTRQVLIVGALTAIGETVLSASLVPELGLGGAAYSRVAMFVAGCALSLYFIRRYLPRRTDYSFFARALAGSAAPAVVVYALSDLVSDRVITLIPYTLLGVAIFLGAARILRLFTPDDRTYLSHLLPAGLKWVLRLI